MDSNFEQKTLAHINIVKGLAHSLGGGFNKSFGQNFLINQNSLLKFIKSINLSADDIVIEIGPGIGVVSYTLCEIAKKAYLIEIDRTKETALAKVLENYTNYEIIWSDASNFNYKELIERIHTEFPEAKPENIKLIGSLPYNVSKRIIYQILTSQVDWHEASFFLQREVADNYVARPPQAEFLATSASIFADVEFAFGIPAEHFIPKPKVKTGVIHLKKHAKYDHLDKVKFSAFIKSGFEQPRKTVVNNLKSRGLSTDLMASLGIKETARPSELNLEQWEKLFQSLSK